MANEIQIFNNPEFGEIRTAGTSEEPLFCLADVCNAIGVKDVSRCASRLDDDVRQTHPISDRMGRTQQATFVTEAGLYDVVIRSDSDKAAPFRRWVTKEVLPSLRKHGTYSVDGRHFDKIPLTPSTVRASLEWVKGVSEMLNLNDSSKLALLGQVAQPLGLPVPDYTPSHGTLRPATELLKAHGIKMSAQDFNKLLAEKGYLATLTRKSSGGKEKRFKSITAKGLSYGENQVSPHNPRETQPLWYEDKFAELLELAGLAERRDVA